ncbi:MAG: 50S ribosomal protein L18 [Proteobacteria bacterium]|jgi:large subunit ribosomal protein L18|nr:50S ribosomal protein L18 [Pseudomonadota bacterium]NLN61636.1 50S ribosomal protein L18 [Myxococcales bacterium]
MKSKSEIRGWRKKRIQKKIRGTDNQPRLSVFRSASHIYAQIVNDDQRRTLLAVSSLCPDIRQTEGNKTEIAKKVGTLIAQKCLEQNIKKVVFDRNGFVYHGRIKALADGAREAGLEF